MSTAPAWRETIEREGSPFEAGSDRPLLLEGRRGWWVESGWVDLFSLPLEEGRPAGSRTHLFRAGPGRFLFGTGREPAPGIGLLAVGSAGTRLRELSDERIRELVSRPDLAGPMGELLDGWVDLLCEAISRGIPTDRCPLAGHAWIEAAPGSRLRVAATADLLAGGAEEVWSGLDRFHGLVLESVRRMAEESAGAERERLRQRAAAGRWAFSDAFSLLASTLEPRDARPRLRVRPSAEGAEPSGADALLAACRLVGEALDIPIRRPHRVEELSSGGNPLAAVARASRFRLRQVLLRDGWWREEGGPLIAFASEDRRPLALLPVPGGYLLQDPVRRAERRVGPEEADLLDPRAFTFYRPFPDQPLGLRDLLRFGLRGCRRDLLVVVAMGIATGLLSLVTPVATGMIFNDLIPGAARVQLLHLMVILLVIAVSTAMLHLTSSIALLRIEGKMGSALQAAVWDRLLALPMPFFRPYTAGDLAVRAMGIDAIRQILSGATVTALLSGIFSLFHLGLLFHYSVSLAWWAALLLLGAVLTSCLVSFLQLSHQREISALQAKLSGAVLQFLTSVAKLRVAGAEVHAFSIWARRFGEQRRLQFRARRIGNLLAAFNAAFPVVCSLVIFALAMPQLTREQTLQTGDFLAFVSSFGFCLTNLLAASAALLSTLSVVPLYEQAKPILETVPEVDTAKADPGPLSGEIEAQHLSFRYAEDGPPVLRDVSFHVRPGEFVAFVGPSGSGKSTIFRLLLGFERPESGAIYYDGQDLSGLDLREVRGQIGVVLQSGRLMPGDIFTNIVGSAPLTLDDAWEAARMAGLDADVKAMPMGMHTVIGEGGGTLSGGQRQRLMIARAIVRRPKILLFDEATSALDNRTQAIVSESLERLRATRIVVAHRLSTILHADRIHVVEGGRIVQTGTYEELMARGGPFAELAKRQLV